jgi:hypothetical protein
MGRAKPRQAPAVLKVDANEEIKQSARVDYCAECIFPINPRTATHIHNGTPLCPSRKPTPYTGPEIEVKFDAETHRKIAASKADPRDSRNWERHAAADGNKAYRVWKPKDDSRWGQD